MDAVFHLIIYIKNSTAVLNYVHSINFQETGLEVRESKHILIYHTCK
jgi:hypothetical protein